MEKNFSAQDICSIIKLCSESGVQDLSLGKIRVIFKSEVPEKFEEVPLAQQEVVRVEVTERDELAHKDEILAQMELEDPVGYEKLMLSGDLGNSKVGDEPDEGHSGAEPPLY